jgi:hypothetical protein
VILSAPLAAQDLKWKKHDINTDSRFEAAGALDADNDGILDIVSGAFWYKGPSFEQKYPVRDVTQTHTYLNCFSTIPYDVNSDGHMDFVTCSYFEKNVGWVENPGKPGEKWTYHNIDNPGSSETAVGVDLTRDGTLEVLPNTVNTIVFYELEGEGTQKAWKKYELGQKGAGHGVGSGDVNGDGYVDILTPRGWYQAPPRPRAQPWEYHEEWNLGAAGIQCLARDVDGDGLSDVIFGQGHARGLEWLKQGKDDQGNRTWTRLPIDMKLPEVHALHWLDIDNDGAAELLTGKRTYGHEVEPGDTDAPILAYFTFDKAKKDWVKHLIWEGQAATNAPSEAGQRDAMKDFPKGSAGTGVEFTPVDIDKDGDLDLVCPGKTGLYLFENLGK